MNRLLALLLLGALLALGSPATAAPKAELWARWQQHDAESVATVDHAAWGRLLGRYVRPGKDGVNRFAYAEVTPADRAALDGYLAMLAAVPVSTLEPAGAAGLLAQSLQRAHRLGRARPLSDQIDPRHRHLAGPVQPRALAPRSW